ncbi:MAG: hypothetical protein JWM18_5264 [Chloroflexi bacterium]|jgi:hypothetical protein|nr:hypothetical protein [Chloroflexota bacterium]
MLSDDDLVEAAHMRRRRVLAALHDGTRAQEPPGARTLTRLAAGLGVSTLLALGTAVGGLVHASLHDQAAGASPPAATSAPAATPRAGG